MTATESPGKLIDEARLNRKYAHAARSLIATLRVAPHEVAIEKKTGLLGRLRKQTSGETTWEGIAGLDSIVLQEALFEVEAKFDRRAREIENRVIVKPQETP
jgi:hypothetical protein